MAVILHNDFLNCAGIVIALFEQHLKICQFKFININFLHFITGIVGAACRAFNRRNGECKNGCINDACPDFLITVFHQRMLGFHGNSNIK